jgi:hypothetical protein
MTRWPINAHPIIVMVAIAIGLDCISIGITDVIVINLDCISIGVAGGFGNGLDGGSFNQFHLAVLGYQPQQSVDSSDRRLLWLSAKRVLWATIL